MLSPQPLFPMITHLGAGVISELPGEDEMPLFVRE